LVNVTGSGTATAARPSPVFQMPPSAATIHHSTPVIGSEKTSQP
jgi:hypothetical protein